MQQTLNSKKGETKGQFLARSYWSSTAEPPVVIVYETVNRLFIEKVMVLDEARDYYETLPEDEDEKDKTDKETK